MSRFVISDTHFGHENAWKTFKLEDGSPLRPFSSTEEMDEFMVEQWNKTVNPKDTVYHLGDVVIARRNLPIVKRLNGRKILVRGNHDIFKDRDYYEAGFEQIHGVRVFTDKCILSHIPLHPDCVTDRFKLNIHGHLHARRVQTHYAIWVNGEVQEFSADDPRYYCVSVEQTNYRPLELDKLCSTLSN